MEKLFVYGTLRYARFQKECWGASFEGARASLPHYERSRIVIGGRKFWVLYSKQGSVARGVVLNIPKESLAISDVYEEKYRRRKVELLNKQKAWTYVVKPEYLKKKPA